MVGCYGGSFYSFCLFFYIHEKCEETNKVVALEQKCVDSYREAMRIARSKRSIRIVPHSLTSPETLIPSFNHDPTVIGINDYFLDEKRRQGSFVNRFGLTNKSFSQRRFGKRERVGKNYMRREDNGLFWIMSESSLNFSLLRIDLTNGW